MYLFQTNLSNCEGWKGALEDKQNTKEAQERLKNDSINNVTFAA